MSSLCIGSTFDFQVAPPPSADKVALFAMSCLAIFHLSTGAKEMVRVYSFLSFGQVEIVVREERRDDESVVREEMMKEEKLVALSPHERPPRSPSGGPRLIIAAQSGIEYILKPLLSTLCPCRRYISRCTTGALPVFVWNFYRICK